MQTYHRNSRRRLRRERNGQTAVITDALNCCDAPESIESEMYDAETGKILMLTCCDCPTGCHEVNARRRCVYWPSFAHPRWLTCSELYNRTRYCFRR